MSGAAAAFSTSPFRLVFNSIEGDYSIHVPTFTAASVTMRSDGFLRVVHDGDTTDYRVILGTASDYFCRLQQSSGDAPSGSAVNTYLDIGNSPSWTWGIGDIGSFVLSLAYTSGGQGAVSMTVSIAGDF